MRDLERELNVRFHRDLEDFHRSHRDQQSASLFRAFSRGFLFERVRTKRTVRRRRNVLLRAFRDSRNYAAWIIVSKISIFLIRPEVDLLRREERIHIFANIRSASTGTRLLEQHVEYLLSQTRV